MKIYDKIKELSKEKKIPITKIAETIGMTRDGIASWNESSPSAIKLKAVADILGTTVDGILEDCKED